MKEYTVRVTETNAWNIKIQAEDGYHAISLVTDLYNHCTDFARAYSDDFDTDIEICDFAIVGIDGI